MVVCLLAIIGLSTFGYSALANDKTSSETISQMNEQLTVIENKLMVNSQIYNDSQALIEAEKVKQAAAMSGNALLRSEKAKLISDKEAKLLWK